jgi:GNAT superfamily N-acetyltransferase
MSFIKDVWGGHDYIPRVWDEWIRDRKNRMFVVEADGVPVGMNRIRFLQDGTAWFEGARVHPAFRGKGLATMLGENSMKVAKERGIRVFRLTSGSRNRAAHRQIARIKFRELARFSIYTPPNASSRESKGQLVRPSRFREVQRAVDGSVEYRLGHGAFWHNWGAASLTPQVLKSLIEEGAVWSLGGSVAVTRAGGEGREIWEEVGFVGGRPADAVALVKSLLGRREDASMRWAFVPHGSPIIHALKGAGFKREFSNILFERRAAKG